VENLTDVVDRLLYGLDPLGGGGGPVDPSLLDQELKTPGPHDPKTPPGVGTKWHVGSRDSKWPLEAGTGGMLVLTT
jgi:hypothetical protein